MKTTREYRYYSKYTNENGEERFELFWAKDYVEAQKEAISREISGMKLQSTNRCVCITPRVKVSHIISNPVLRN